MDILEEYPHVLQKETLFNKKILTICIYTVQLMYVYCTLYSGYIYITLYKVHEITLQSVQCTLIT